MPLPPAASLVSVPEAAVDKNSRLRRLAAYPRHASVALCGCQDVGHEISTLTFSGTCPAKCPANGNLCIFFGTLLAFVPKIVPNCPEKKSTIFYFAFFRYIVFFPWVIGSIKPSSINLLIWRMAVFCETPKYSSNSLRVKVSLASTNCVMMS